MGSVKYAIGVDFGSDSVRALVVNVHTGESWPVMLAITKDGQGLYCDAAANQFRQHPQDYLDALRVCEWCLEKCPLRLLKM